VTVAERRSDLRLTLFDFYSADHAIPVVIGTPKIICSVMPRGSQENVFHITGLHQNLGAFSIEDFGIVNGSDREEQQCREFVRFLAVVLQVQAIMRAVLRRIAVIRSSASMSAPYRKGRKRGLLRSISTLAVPLADPAR
jgi:hypothetical protein